MTEQYRRPKWTPKKRRTFLALLAEGHAVKYAAEAVRFARSALYERRAEDPEFARDWAAAEDAGTEVLEQEARRRAVEGVVHETPIYYQGDHVGSVVETKYSDTLLMFLLKARRPDKYRERQDVHYSGQVNLPVQVQHDFDFAAFEQLYLGLVDPGAPQFGPAADDGAGEPLDPAHADEPAGGVPDGSPP
jgi:hypothetical protein